MVANIKSLNHIAKKKKKKERKKQKTVLLVLIHLTCGVITKITL